MPEDVDLLRSSWTFVPGDPPRSGHMAVWDPTATGGLFAMQAAASGGPDLEPLDVARFDGERVRCHSAAAQRVDVARSLDVLLGDTVAARSDSSQFWARATHAALGLIARGHVVPAVSAAGWDAWQIDPLEPADHEVLAALASACPPDAHALTTPARELRVVDPVWLIRAWFDAVADAFVRTAAAPLSVGTHLFGAMEPTPAEPARSWVSSAFGHLTSATQLGLRVEPVPPDDSSVPAPAIRPPFDIVIQLRSAQDPSLVVDAGSLVDLPSSVRTLLGDGVGEELLSGIARAARLWPTLDPALDDERPSSVPAGIDDLESLLDAAPDLEAAGVEVLWPQEFVADVRPRLVATGAPASESSDVTVGLDSLLDFKWELLCDGVALTETEVAEVADAKRSIVWLRGRWIRVDGSVIRRIRQLPEGLDGPGGLAAALAGEATDSTGQRVEVVAVGFAAALRERLGELAGVREEPDPDGLRAPLRAYQRRGVAWMADLCRAGLGGILADDMGLGKTIQVIALHLVLQSGASRRRPMLVVCPTSLVGNWAREIGRFAPDVPVRRFTGPDRSLADIAPNEIVLVTYGVMRQSAEELAEHEWSVVVADEAQQVKNPRARTSRALRTIPAGARVALTGTPVENRLSELWALLDWTTPGLLGGFERFRSEFSVPIERHGSCETAERLRLLSRPFMLRRKKTDPGVAPDLPSRTQLDVVVGLSGEQLSMYEALVRESLSRIRGSEGITRQGLVIQLLTSLKQIANHPDHFLKERHGPLAGRSGKLDAAAQLVTSAVGGSERVIVFSQYVEMCRLLRRRFGELGVDSEILYGGLSSGARDELVERFQSGDLEVLVLSLRAGGTGLNLTAATQVIHFDRWWNPAVEDQATDRAWRIGQTKPVVVHRLIAEGTIDERIAEMIERKRQFADSVVGTGEAWIGDLDDDGLMQLVALSTSQQVFA